MKNKTLEIVSRNTFANDRASVRKIGKKKGINLCNVNLYHLIIILTLQSGIRAAGTKLAKINTWDADTNNSAPSHSAGDITFFSVSFFLHHF